MKLILFSLIALAFMACEIRSGAEQLDDRGEPISVVDSNTHAPLGNESQELDHIKGGEPLYGDVQSFCELCATYPIVAHLIVERIVSEMGADPNGRIAEQVPTVRVEFEPIQNLRGNEPAPTLTMNGGVWPDGSTTHADIEFTIGEEIILFFGNPSQVLDNGSLHVGPQQVFRKGPEGGFTNGVLLGREIYDVERLRQMVLQAESGACGDVPPDTEIDQANGEQAEDEDERPTEPVPDVGE